MAESIGQILVKAGVITDEQLDYALEEQKESGGKIGNIIIHKKWAKEDDVLNVLSKQFGIPIVKLSSQQIDASLAKKIPAKFAYRYKLVPLEEKDEILTVAVNDPLDFHALDDIRLLLECEINSVLSSEKDILKAIKKIYGVGAETMEQLAVSEQKEPKLQEKKAQASQDTDAEDASIVKFVNQIIREAFIDRATDIHIEPFEDDLIVRYRIDGILHEIPTPSSVKDFQSSIISRIKIMADMNIAEKRLPQDGRIEFEVDKEAIDLRVSTLPTLHGESIDLRILPRTQTLLGLEQLGLPKPYQKTMANLIKLPHGIILVTGPTGHGKTTTLYACLSRINSVDKKIITVEDPVEYQIKGINQVPVHSKIGLSFANGLRSILRQDPDIIMVGEIRDQETAEIAIRASLTGHLVFSTLHTNDASGAVTRLIDMGIEPYLVSSSIEAILAQRLVRLVCPKCKVQDKPEKEFLHRIGFNLPSDVKIFKAGSGCEECRHTGYKGRTGIYELLVLDEELRRLVLDKTSAGNIKKHALKKGMHTLRDNGWEKVIAGLTTIEEVIRVTQEEELI